MGEEKKTGGGYGTVTGAYLPQELLRTAAWLARRYTSGESSSVPYETAQMLMEAVLYCLREESASGGESAGDGAEVSAGRPPDIMTAYRSGYDKVLRKGYEAKRIYESLLEEFDDYGCFNYREMILKGLPAFFARYDARFRPQDHLLTLDYPLLNGTLPLTGIDLILPYLTGIRIEMRILSCFDRTAVVRLLTRLQPDYEELYLDNLCEPVLLAAVICFLADRPVWSPAPEGRDLLEAAACLRELSREEREQTVRGWLRLIGGQADRRLAEGESTLPYLEQAAGKLADRLYIKVKDTL